MAEIKWTNERRKLKDLKPWERNPRQITKDQAKRLVESFNEFGQVETIAIGPNNEVYNGHQRLNVLKDKYGDEYEVEVRVSSQELTEKQREKLTVYLHKGAAGVWDFDTLSEFDLDDLLEWGFDKHELDLDLWAEDAPEDVEPQIDKAEELREKWGVETGQLWQLGEHRLICGDCTDKAVVEKVMGGEKAVLCHADPPYGMGKEKDGVENDNLYREKLDAFQMEWWKACRPYLTDNASVYIWGEAEHLWRLWYSGGLKNFERLTFRNEIVWNKKSGQGMNSDLYRMYPVATERCLFFMLGEQGFNNNADNYWEGWDSIRNYLRGEADKVGLTASTLKQITGVGMYTHWFSKSQWELITEEHYRKLQDAFKREYDAFKREYDELKREYDELKREFYATRAYFDNTHEKMTDVIELLKLSGDDRYNHATPKPVELVSRAIMTSSPIGEIVLVPFGGTSPEIIACERLGRKCRAVEISPAYVAVAIQRWVDVTNGTPELVN